MLPNHNKELQQFMVLRGFQHFKNKILSTSIPTQTTKPSHQNFFRVLQLQAKDICNKKEEVLLFIENSQPNIITIQESKLNQPNKAPNIPHFTLI